MTDAQSGGEFRGGTGAPRSRRVVRGAWSAVRLAARACPWWLTGNVLATLASALLPVATVWLLKHSLDALTTGAASTAFPPAAVALVVAGLLAATLPSLTEYVQNEVSRAIGRRAQSDLYVATARLAGLARLEDPAFHDRLRMAQSAGRSSPGQVVGGVIGTGQLVLTLGGLAAVLARPDTPGALRTGRRVRATGRPALGVAESALAGQARRRAARRRRASGAA